MCGVVGYSPVNMDSAAITRSAFYRLFDESRVRGHHAYGIAQDDGGGVWAHRSFDWLEIPATFNPEVVTIAHTRYCQSGDWQIMENNQPLVVNDTALAFNGCIHMGTKPEFELAFNVHCDTDNDGEIFMRKCLIGNERAEDWLGAIQGSFAGVWLLKGKIYAGRNPRRPLWTCEAFGGKWIASTANIFKRAGFPSATEMPPGVMAL